MRGRRFELGGAGQGADGDVALERLRGAYRAPGRLVHPDKLRGFDGATRAFQALVMALTRDGSGPPVESEEAEKGPGMSAQTRRVRTIVACPRCEGPGALRKEACRLFVQLAHDGIAGSTCSTCLCEFGERDALL